MGLQQINPIVDQTVTIPVQSSTQGVKEIKVSSLEHPSDSTPAGLEITVSGQNPVDKLTIRVGTENGDSINNINGGATAPFSSLAINYNLPEGCKKLHPEQIELIRKAGHQALQSGTTNPQEAANAVIGALNDAMSIDAKCKEKATGNQR